MPGEGTVGLIGIGLMGEAMAQRLLASDMQVLGFDIDSRRNRRLASLGGRAAVSPEEVVRDAQPIVLAVFSTDQVEETIEATLPQIGHGSGKIILCTSTCDPDRIAMLSASVESRGAHFLETPVSGTSEQVRRGEGVGLIGGDRAVAAAVKPVLDVIFPRRFHVGRPGDGARAKLAVNLILGLNRLALAEGLVFASRLGLDPKAFLTVARGSAAYSQVMDTKGPKMVNGDFSPEGRVRQTLKDVHLMLEQAGRAGQPLPSLEVHAAVLEALVERGDGDLDNSAVIEEIRRRGMETQDKPGT